MILLEIIFYTVIFAIMIGITVFAAGIAATAAGIFALIILATGWFPILMCAVDSELYIGSGFFGTWALWSLYLYTTASIVIVILMVVRPDPDGLPPGWKFLAMFYWHETTATVRSAAEDVRTNFDGERFAQAVRNAPSSLFTARIQARAMRRETERTRAKAERMEAAADLSEAAIDMELQKARQEELRRYKNRKKTHE